MPNVLIIGLRHGKAKASSDKSREADLARPLLVEGLQQARARRDRFPESIGQSFVFSSPAIRAVTTLSLVLDRDPRGIKTLPQLYCTPEGDDGAVWGRLFEALGYESLGAYRQHELNVNRTVERYGEIGRRAILDQIGPPQNMIRDSTILLAGHAICTIAIVMELVRGLVDLNQTAQAFFDGASLDETGVITALVDTDADEILRFEII